MSTVHVLLVARTVERKHTSVVRIHSSLYSRASSFVLVQIRRFLPFARKVWRIAFSPRNERHFGVTSKVSLCWSLLTGRDRSNRVNNASTSQTGHKSNHDDFYFNKCSNPNLQGNKLIRAYRRRRYQPAEPASIAGRLRKSALRIPIQYLWRRTEARNETKMLFCKNAGNVFTLRMVECMEHVSHPRHFDMQRNKHSIRSPFPQRMAAATRRQADDRQQPESTATSRVESYFSSK